MTTCTPVHYYCTTIHYYCTPEHYYCTPVHFYFTGLTSLDRWPLRNARTQSDISWLSRRCTPGNSSPRTRQLSQTCNNQILEIHSALRGTLPAVYGGHKCVGSHLYLLREIVAKMPSCLKYWNIKRLRALMTITIMTHVISHSWHMSSQNHDTCQLKSMIHVI